MYQLLVQRLSSKEKSSFLSLRKLSVGSVDPALFFCTEIEGKKVLQ